MILIVHMLYAAQMGSYINLSNQIIILPIAINFDCS